MRQPEIDDHQVQPLAVLPDPGQHFVGSAGQDGPVTGVGERRTEPLTHKRGIVRDEDRLGYHV